LQRDRYVVAKCRVTTQKNEDIKYTTVGTSYLPPRVTFGSFLFWLCIVERLMKKKLYLENKSTPCSKNCIYFLCIWFCDLNLSFRLYFMVDLLLIKLLPNSHIHSTIPGLLRSLHIIGPFITYINTHFIFYRRGCYQRSRSDPAKRTRVFLFF